MFKNVILTLVAAAAIGAPLTGGAIAAPQAGDGPPFACWDDSADSFFAPQCRDDLVLQKQPEVTSRKPPYTPPTTPRQEQDFFERISFDGGGDGGDGGGGGGDGGGGGR